MARLRIRIELSRGGVGVPLHKLASVVDEAQKFFHMLAEDVEIDPEHGEWLGFDFDNQCLNFTAEYIGAVNAAQVDAFYAAFDGTTALRRSTIAQFARITEGIGEEELVGFGLYDSENDAEPSEWRCLSRRDALRIAEEMQMLLGAGADKESHLPAVSDKGASLFGRAQGAPREDESGLAERLTRVERKVDQHSAQIHDLRSQSAATEDSFRNLLTAVEGFCDQAAHQIERISPAALPAPRRVWQRWRIVTSAGVLGIALLIIAFRMWPARPAEPVIAKSIPAAVPQPPPQPTPEPAPEPTPEPAPVHPRPMRIELDASEPSWVAMSDAAGNRVFAGLVSPGNPRTFEVDRTAKLRTGNAGGLDVKLNGKSLGELGPRGKVREIEFKDNAFTITNPSDRP